MSSWSLRRLTSSQFIRSVTTLVSAGVAGQLIQLAVTPLVTRLYTPSEFGIFAVFSAVLSILLVVSGLRYELAIPLLRWQGNARALVALVLCLNAMSALVIAVVVLFWGRAIAEWAHVPDLAGILWLLPVTVFLAGTYRTFYFWSVRAKAFKTIARTRVIQSAGNAALQVTGGYLAQGPLGLAIGQAAALSMGTLSLSRLADLSALKSVQRSLLRRMQALARNFSRFPKFDVPAALVDEISVQLPNILLASLFSPVIAGYYMLADRLVMRPLGLISQSIGQVFYSRNREQIDHRSIGSNALRIALTLSAAMVIPVILMFLFAETIFANLLGEKWRVAGNYAAWLTIGMAAQFVYSSISLTLMATSAQNINLYIHGTMLALKTAALLIGYFAGSEWVAIVAVALAGALGYLAAIALVIVHTSRYRPSAGLRR